MTLSPDGQTLTLRGYLWISAAFVGLGATPRKSQNQRLRAVTSPSSTTALTRCSGTNPSTVEPSWTLVRIPASARSKRAGAVAASVGGLFRLRIRQRQPVAAPRHHLSDTLFVLVWLSDNRRLAVFVLVFFILVFLVFIIVIIGVSRRRRLELLLFPVGSLPTAMTREGLVTLIDLGKSVRAVAKGATKALMKSLADVRVR